MLIQLSKQTDLFSKQKYGLQTKVIKNRNITHKKSTSLTLTSLRPIFSTICTADDIVLQPQSVIKTPQLDNTIDTDRCGNHPRDESSGESNASTRNKSVVILDDYMITCFGMNTFLV